MLKAEHGFYVAPYGGSGGDGSHERPWDLADALAGNYPIGPGDLLWLRGGTYVGDFVSHLTGTAEAPILVRQYPEERAIIDGSLKVKGEWTTYWGFEVTNSNPSQPRLNGVMVFGPHTKFINMVVHDNSGSGFGTWSEAPDSEIYGSIIYNNGVDKFNHGIYVQNQTGTKYIRDNIIFNQSGLGIHGYSLPGEYLHGFYLEGNVSFENGTRSAKGAWPNILVGGETSADAIVLVNNYTYHSSAAGEYDVDLGYQSVTNRDIVIKDNYFAGSDIVLHIRDWDKVTMTGNTFYGTSHLVDLQLAVGESAAGYEWSNNTYFADGLTTPFDLRDQTMTFEEWQQATSLDQTSRFINGRPTEAKIVVRPNAYERGRANIIVYNWNLADVADVDVSKIVRPGDRYFVWNVQDYFGPPVASGIYNGTPIRLPMTGVRPPAPVRDTGSESVVTGPEFNVFVLTSKPDDSAQPIPTALALPTCTPKFGR